MVELVTAGVDWLSATMHNSERDYHQWRADCIHALENVAKEGHILKERGLLGYRGVSAGNCFVGENDTHSFAQFTGSYADMAFDYVQHENAHFSRIDLQATVKLVVMDLSIGKVAYRGAMQANNDLSEGRRRKIWIIIGSDGGDTVYIGSASSEQRGRIYNKEVQSENVEFTRCWRYEVVFKNGLSTSIQRELSNTRFSRAERVLDCVIAWYTKRGVNCGLLGSGTGIALPIIRSRPTDIERKLKWLSVQVYPTVRYLLDQGYGDTIRVLLGLSDLQ